MLYSATRRKKLIKQGNQSKPYYCAYYNRLRKFYKI